MNRWPLLLVAIAALSVGSCAKLTLAWADLKPDGPAARPEVLGGFQTQAPVASLEDWTDQRRPALKDALQANIYGYFPDSYKLTVLDRKLLDENAFGGGRLEEYKLRAQLRFGEQASETKTFYMDVVTPAGVPDAPIILIQTFCPRWDTLPHPAIYRPEGAGGCGGGVATGLMTYVFGRYIATPPTQMILARGYGVATIYPSEFAPDRKNEGLTALKQLSKGVTPERQRWGAIAAWAWGYSLMIDALEEGAEGSRDYISWGHSRYGKSALLAAAFDDRISAVISHQSGTGGASLNRQKKGESVKAIVDGFPHWFAKAYENYAGEEETMPIDQHHLLALIAPRPVLLGNARRDVWSDPNGAFRAAVGADPVYKLYGAQGLDQTRLDIWAPAADIAYWIRPGTHGVVKEDWPAFLEFLDAHFSTKSGGLP